jgi:EAL domain-containing protein (putative c-di-GMP-specific phosphodiesterase class I)
LVHFIESRLKFYHIDAKYFGIEVTESVIEDFELVIPKLNTLKKMGVGIALDDFGTGYSSLNFIKHLPIDRLKIDRSFVQDLLRNANDISLVKTIIEIGNTLKLTVVAEGIETKEHLDKLINLNCPVGQGYYFSKPLKTSEIEAKFFYK